MARIEKADHASIVQMVQVEGIRASEVAAKYGCTPANIYAIIARQKRADAPALPIEAPVGISEPAPKAVRGRKRGGAAVSDMRADTALEAMAVVDSDLFDPNLAAAPAPETVPVPAVAAVVLSEPLAPQVKMAPPLPRRSEAGRSESARSEPARAEPSRRMQASARPPSMKGGYGLTMRSPEGDENTAPFRSLEDLLMTAKQLLRTAARSPEPVWFSIQPIDLANFEAD